MAILLRCSANSGETGIDCGGSCSSCISFSVAADEPAYNLTKSVYLTVIARANSTVNVTIKRQRCLLQRIFSPVFAGAPISETRVIDNTSNAGNYTIYAVMRYLNISEYKNTTLRWLRVCEPDFRDNKCKRHCNKRK